MKIFQKIISIVLVLIIFNVVLGKAFHEFFEHDHEVQECELAGTTHFHDIEFAHLDFICDFNFSASLLDDFLANSSEIIRYQENKVKIHFLWLAKNICFSSISLRGPPSSL